MRPTPHPRRGTRLGLLLATLGTLAGAVAGAAPPPEGGSQKDRTRATSAYKRAVALMQGGEFSSAIPLLEATLRLGDYRNAVWNLAVCYRSMGRLSEAAAMLERFLAHPRASAAERAQAGESLESIRRLLARLTVRTRPAGARLTLDGRELGPTPLELTVDPGPHRLELRSAGFVSRRTEVTLAPSESRALDLALTLLPASLTLRSDPVGALVRVDGQELGHTPLEARLSPGTHELVLRVPGRRPARRRIAAEPGERLALDVPLVPLEASLLVSVDRPGASVLVDGQAVGRTPLPPHSLQPGRHLLAVRLAGYDTWTSPVGLEDRQVVTASVRLRRGRLHPAWFAATASAAVALAATAGGLYAESVGAGASFGGDLKLLGTSPAPREARQARDRAEAALGRSDRYYAASTGLFISSAVLAATAGVLALFTRFGRSQGTLETGPAASLSPAAP